MQQNKKQSCTTKLPRMLYTVLPSVTQMSEFLLHGMLQISRSMKLLFVKNWIYRSKKSAYSIEENYRIFFSFATVYQLMVYYYIKEQIIHHDEYVVFSCAMKNKDVATRSADYNNFVTN